MSNQHTPGPWKTYRGSIWSESKEIDRSKWSNVVAAISPNLKKPESQKEADARLIAAAPDLLDALRKCKAALQDHGHYGDIEIGIAEAAIDKAEGRV